MNQTQTEVWLDSKAARKLLKVSTCELSHLRAAGHLQFQKQGNAFLYSGRAIQLLLKRQGQTPAR